jgi:hypothetical protein
MARVVALLFIFLIAAGAWWWTHPSDPDAELRARMRPLERLEREAAPHLGRGVERWRMIAAGDTVTALWKPGVRNADVAPWVVVLLGGIGTDDRAALLMPDGLPIDVLAVSWPWTGSRHMNPGEFLASVPDLREAMLRTPAAIALGVEAARRTRPGARVGLVGASLGVPPTVATLALAPVDALVLIDGAADLGRLMRAETANALGGGPFARAVAAPAGALGARLLAPLEPARHGIAAVPPHPPVLIVDAEQERRFPPECVQRLHAAFPGATVVTHPGAHIRPQDRFTLIAIVGKVRPWLEALAKPAP